MPLLKSFHLYIVLTLPILPVSDEISVNIIQDTAYTFLFYFFTLSGCGITVNCSQDIYMYWISEQK